MVCWRTDRGREMVKWCGNVKIRRRETDSGELHMSYHNRSEAGCWCGNFTRQCWQKLKGSKAQWCLEGETKYQKLSAHAHLWDCMCMKSRIYVVTIGNILKIACAQTGCVSMAVTVQDKHCTQHYADLNIGWQHHWVRHVAFNECGMRISYSSEPFQIHVGPNILLPLHVLGKQAWAVNTYARKSRPIFRGLQYVNVIKFTSTKVADAARHDISWS